MRVFSYVIMRSAAPASRKGGRRADPAADMSRARAPGFGPLVASRPVS